ncbi:MAG: cyclic nucleotide-binding domain-containing protein [Arenicellales bacterium]|nr:hypothetical protein [Acidiferrobacteraceae bacterium]MDP6123789.1 cyclic nucleotide-binding domain-containing protein [Arenicellales bacterium]MDP6289423.1 cyclic nucleotide-binding domain-containing protein [Arenicellales bacterium]MDP7155359.1 cyclic nucleotide-binding domain-containing protein [Arenicellales bacterium]MDP7284204.1 cyclic nucleotide-binding domain-containing protein [Arenicellales bacterium]
MVSLSTQSLKVLRERVPLFEGFNDDELSVIMACSQRRVLTAGEQLIAEGALANKLFIIVSGEAAIYRSLAGREEVIARLKPGATVGEIGIVDRAPRSAKVVADDALVLLELEHKILEEVSESLLVKLYRNLALILATRLRETNDMLDNVADFSTNA